MRLQPLDMLVAGALLLVGGAPARAQVTAAPESLRVVLPQGGEATHSVTLTNGGAVAVSFCLDFDRPLQRSAGGALGSRCGPPGELLRRVLRSEVPGGGSMIPYAVAMTPDGRLFVADNKSLGRTYEFGAALDVVRSFPTPFVHEPDGSYNTLGLTYNEDTGTLWWTNVETDGGFEVRRVLLLEGTLDGAPTGRRIELPRQPGVPPYPFSWPYGAAYDPATRRYHYVDEVTEDLWAVDTLGVVQPGYPVRLARYPQADLGNGLDVHGRTDGGPEGVRLEVPVALGGEPWWSRVVVTDPLGRDLGLETPVPSFGAGWDAGVTGNVVRSRLDPNGAMYVAFRGRNAQNVVVYGVAAFRPIPLSPSWLALGAWSGTVPPEGSAEVALTFRAGERAPGEYRATLVVEDTTGAVLAAVPLVLVVEAGTPTEEGPGSGGVTLSVAPNPTAGRAAVTLRLDRSADIRIVVYDLLGRQVEQLHNGVLFEGAHQFMWDTVGVARGTYFVWAEGGGRKARRVVTVVR